VQLSLGTLSCGVDNGRVDTVLLGESGLSIAAMVENVVRRVVIVGCHGRS
jgi:hypothetical protein